MEQVLFSSHFFGALFAALGQALAVQSSGVLSGKMVPTLACYGLSVRMRPSQSSGTLQLMRLNQDISPEKKAYRWLMRQVLPARNWLVLSILLGVLNGVLLLVQASLLAGLMDALVMQGQTREQQVTGFLLSIAVVLLRASCAWGREYCGFQAGLQVRRDIRQALLDKLQRLGPLGVSGQAVGSWTTVVVEQVEQLQAFVARYLPQMALAALVPLVILAVVVPKNWTVALIFLGTAPLIPVFMALVGIKAAEANRRNFRALERLGGFFLDRLQGMETLRLFRRTAATQQALGDACEDFREKTMEVLRLAFLSSTVLDFFASVAIALTAVYLGMSFLGYIDFGDYGGGVSLYTAMFLLLLAPEFYQPLRDLGTFYHAKAKAIAAAESILAVMTRAEPAEHQGSQAFQGQGAVAIEARGLSVCSPTRDTVLLDQLNFRIAAGSRVAIIGPSGAGKTTLINTLMGFYPFQGQLHVSGQPLSDLALSGWRQHLAWLGQHPFIMAGTIRDNIACGRNLTSAQLLAALNRAQGLDILENLPEQLDSPLREQGANLSVGQAQRIALARALATPVGLLVLDEPTAALDADSERQVLAALGQISRDTTVITVTHRISQIMAMEQILMIDAGRLVAAGDPAQLIAQPGPFRTFIEGQGRSLDNA